MTSNDTEGWDNALNRRTDGQSGLPLCLLIELLEREAQLTSITVRLVSKERPSLRLRLRYDCLVYLYIRLSVFNVYKTQQ